MKNIFIISFIMLVFFSGFSFGDIDLWDKNKTNWSKLMLAVYYDDLGKMKLLITEGADINLLTDNYYNALIISIKTQNYGIAEFLIKKGADVKAIYSEETVLMIASRYENIDIIKILLKNGLDINANNDSGYTPLKAAAADGSVAVLKILIENGADINYQGIYGDTALMLAALGGHLEKVKVLLKSCANKNIKNKNIMTAYDYNERAMDYAENEAEIENRKIIRGLLKVKY